MMAPHLIMREFEIPARAADPLQSVRFGFFDDEANRLVLTPGVPTSTEIRFLRRAVGLAREILLHPHAAPVLGEMYYERGQGSPTLTVHVLKYILFTRHWNLVLDRDMQPAFFGSHCRPMQPMQLNDDEATMVFVNYKVRQIPGNRSQVQNVQVYNTTVKTRPSLPRDEEGMARPARQEQKMRNSRILMVMAVAIAHEMCHCLRSIVGVNTLNRLTRSFLIICSRTGSVCRGTHLLVCVRRCSRGSTIGRTRERKGGIWNSK